MTDTFSDNFDEVQDRDVATPAVMPLPVGPISEARTAAPRLRYHRGEIIHDWSLVRHLGSGAGAEVWLAQGPNGSQAALKIMTASSASKLRRFAREIDIMASLESSLSLPVLKAIPPNGTKRPPCLWMPVAQQMPSYLRAHRATPIEIFMIFREVADVLARLHERHIYHCDVKPANIYRYQGRWVMSDFSLSIRQNDLPLTAPNELMGSRNYMAPELAGLPYRDGIDWAKCDVFSWAHSLLSVLYRNAHEKAGETTSGSTVSSSSLDIPRGMERLLWQATSERPEDRPDMREIVAALTAIASSAGENFAPGSVTQR